MGSSRLLRIALAGNALFSLTCAAIMLSSPRAVGQWMGLEYPWVYQVVGGGLIVFGMDLLHQASRHSISSLRALISSLADFGWVLGTAFILVFYGGYFSAVGHLTLMGIAAGVCSFGILQAIGIVRLYKVASRPGVLHYCIRVTTDAPLDALWRIIANLADIKRYAANLADSRMVNSNEFAVGEKGAVRECRDLKGKQWQEELVHIVPNECLTLRFVAEAEDFPFPATAMTGGWAVLPAQQGTQVEVYWDLVPKSALIAFLLMPILEFQIKNSFPAMLGRMTADAKLLAKGEPLSEYAVASQPPLLLGTC